jgi:nicotinate dehydrogenase subunit A
MADRISQITVNGSVRRVDVEPDRSLLSVLRDDLDLTGAKYGCGEGRCGACTVLVDGEPVRSCLARVGALGEKPVTTIEGLGMGSDNHLHPLQQAFLDQGAMQCGYCTTGMIMSGVGLLSKDRSPTDQAVIKAMEGNICRCGTYPRILEAIRQASRNLATQTQGGGR